ncbi:GspE/PulE family protein [Patescibacteria group bacterium]|nr:GspE/PulE family protein [Patescibacteria group bacterium]MBU4353518.1 GspE/PulE family protein [Patescibacteria group bacterium]MBU4477432.1 GspE/PulE family protein [Patescibacteria group bacterium]MCG2699405.1 GspE/PulE family protein [Candidatus Parcubacteria bacterium]
MRVEPQQLKLFLLDSGLATSKDIENAGKKAEKEKKDLGEVLVSEGKLSQDDLSRLQAYILGIPFVSLEKEKIDLSILSLIPEPIARSHNIVAYKKRENELEVAMLDPQDLETIDFIKKKLNLKVLSRLTDPNSIKSVLSQYQKTLQAEFGDIVKQEVESFKIVREEGTGLENEDLKKLAEDLPIVRIVDTLLRHAILQRASDIHIEPMEKEVVVRYRIDGILHDAMVLPVKVASGIIARIKILSNLKVDEKRLPQDGRFKIETPDEKVSFRVSTLPVYNGEKAVLRLLPENSKGFTLEGLGFTAEQIETVHYAVKRPVGMILATGPTGSGKTTTLYTVLDILNTPEVNISTIEDPIEYQMPRINQTQVKPDIGLTFANGLRTLVRQDPDIIMVGEIRDNETAALGINAALTGHLVLSTLHTNSAAGAIPRLLDMKVEPFLLASTLAIIIAQRLVRRLCDSKEKYYLSKDQLKNLGKEVDLDRMLQFLKAEKVIAPSAGWDEVPFYNPKPSKESPDGYKSRVGIHEVLKVTETIKSLLMSNISSDAIEKQAKEEGMMTMLEDGIVKSAQGITTIEEILRVTRE